MENNSDFIQILLEKIEKDDLPTNVFDVEGTDPLVLLGKMNEIIGQLENFQSTVNTSNTTANEALSKANDAVDTSGQALSNANTALSTANQAIGTANQAIKTANQSLETAQEAEDVAGQALSNSNTALNTANTAIDTANTALGTANTALSTSQSANTTSSQALDTANTANATANSALESAGTANTTAETANQNSNQAVTTANEAKGIAETANQNSGQAVTTANEAKETAENALEQVTQGLGTKVYDNSGNLLNQTTFTGSNGINVDMDATSHKNFVVSIDQSVTEQISQNETDINEHTSQIATINDTLSAQDKLITQIEDDVDSLENISKTKVQEITLTGSTGGTITSEQLSTLQADDSNYIILNDEIYRLADKQDASGYRVYTHTGLDNSSFFTKSLTITISSRAWTLTSRTIVDIQSSQNISGVKNFTNGIKIKDSNIISFDGTNFYFNNPINIPTNTLYKIGGVALGQYRELIASIDDTNVATTLSKPITDFSYILIVNRRSGDRRMPILIPVSYLEGNQNVELMLESWDGSRFRIIFTTTTANVSAQYYALPCEIWGII